MDRRDFLRASGSFPALGALLPAFLVEALGRDDACEEDPRTALERARDEAARLGKPVLVFVAPRTPVEQSEFGSVVGDLFQHGDDAFFADLTLVVGAAAPRAELEDAFRGALPAGTLMALIETGDAPQALVPIRASLGPRPEAPPEASQEELDSPRRKAELARWIAPLGAAVRAAISGGPGTLARRERVARAALTEAQRGRVLANLQLDAPATEAQLADVALGAALLRPFAEGEGVAQSEVHALLARAGQQAFLQRSPKGATWWESGHGCGGNFVGEDGPLRVSIACGIGFSPTESRRFLEYYARD